MSIEKLESRQEEENKGELNPYEKMAAEIEEDGGFDTDVIDNLSKSLLEEGIPTCHGKDERWAAHLYPVYLTETMVKSSFFGDYSFMSQFRRNF